MPPRSEHELDPVTLHNQALMNMEQNPSEGFEKLQFLLQQDPFPPETFANLLLLYIKYEVSPVASRYLLFVATVITLIDNKCVFCLSAYTSQLSGAGN